jgi:CBS domain containing-hemolysin-like protein
MDSLQLIKVVFALFLVALNGFFVAAEFAFVKVRLTRLQEMVEGGNFFAKLAYNEVTHIDAYLSATQVGITLASLGLGWIGEPAFAALVEPLVRRLPMGEALATTIGVILAFSIITYLHILFGELIPKTLSIIKAETVALTVALPLYVFYHVFYPIIFVLNRSARFGLKLMGLKPASEHATIHTEEEIRMILAASAQGGSLRDSEVMLVERSFEFADTSVHAVMVPRVDIDFLSIEWNDENVLQTLSEHPHARYVVVENEDLDHVRGFVHLKELVPQVARRKIDLKAILRDLHIVPETQSIERLLREMQTLHTQIALVMDEYGGTAGVVTMEDLVEELVGEVSDEMDEEPPTVQRRDEGFLIQGSAALADVSRELDEELESEHFDSLGGWVMGSLERVPDEGDTVESARYLFRVLKMDGPRIVEIEATSKAAAPLPNAATEIQEREQDKA